MKSKMQKWKIKNNKTNEYLFLVVKENYNMENWIKIGFIISLVEHDLPESEYMDEITMRYQNELH